MTYKIGTIGEFRQWSREVIRDPAAAEGVPKRWFESEGTALAAGDVSAEAVVKLLSPENVMLLQVIGCACISLGTLAMFYIGLALFLTGSGLNVTCINMMLTQRFAPEDPRRAEEQGIRHSPRKGGNGP